MTRLAHAMLVLALLACNYAHTAHPADDPVINDYDLELELETRRNQDNSIYWYMTNAIAKYELLSLHDTELWLQVLGFVYDDYATGEWFTQSLSLNFVYVTSDELDDTVVFRFQDRSEKRTVENYDEDNSVVRLTSRDIGLPNTIEDEQLLLDVVSEILDEGRITIDVDIDDDRVRNVIVARPFPHLTTEMFQILSHLRHGWDDEDVSSSVQFSAVAFDDDKQEAVAEEMKKRLVKPSVESATF